MKSPHMVLLIPLVSLACDVGVSDPLPVVPSVIAHRGASHDAPEHTLASYDLAVSEGANYIEQDIGRTSDGVLVVLHDPTLDRTARGPAASCTGPLREKTLGQVKQCDMGSWFNATFSDRARPEYVGLRIPTLEEVLVRYSGQAGFYIEIKDPELYPGIEAQLVALIQAHPVPPVNLGSPAIFIQSFSAASLRRVRAADPLAATIQLFSTESSAEISAALPEVREYAIGIGPRNANTDASLVAAAHQRCLFVHPYTADTPADISRLMELGVDAIFTNRPRLMVDQLPSSPTPGFRFCGRQP